MTQQSNFNHLAAIGRLVFALFFGLLSGALLPAQTPRAALHGTVEDETSGRVPAARITLRAADFFLSREALTDARGEFFIGDLPPGAYRLTIEKTGFGKATSQVRLMLGTSREIVVTVKPSSIEQIIRLDEEVAPLAGSPLDRSSAVHQTVIGARELQALPLAQRSFANIAYLAPGTEPVEPSDPTKARITAISTGGSSGLNNELSVDGGDNSDDYIGGFLQNFSPEAIEEFSFRTAQHDADTGRTTAGSVVIATKSGTNTWHGEAGFYGRAADLNARFPIDNPTPNAKQPFSRQNYVGTLGGPLVKDRLWFFSSFEAVREEASIAYSPASQTQFAALSQLAGEGVLNANLAGASVGSFAVPSSAPVPFRDYPGLLRLDWAQSANSRWFLRAADDSYTTHNALLQQGALPSTGATAHNNYGNLLLGQNYVFNTAMVGSFILEASDLHLTQTRNSHLGFALAFPFTISSSTISGFETLGDNQFATPITAFPVLRNQQKIQVRYDLTQNRGRHDLRYGVNFIHEPVLGGALASDAEYLYSPPRDPLFYASNPSALTAILTCNPNDPAHQAPNPPCPSTTYTPAGNGTFSQNVQRLGFFAQDSFRATARLTLNYGLRYDTTLGLFSASGREQTQNPAYRTLQALQIPLVNGVPHDYRAAWAPRLGIAYDPRGGGKTVLRAGIGLYYNDLAQTGWVAALQAVNTAPGPCVDPRNPPDATNGRCLPAGAPGALIDPRYKTPYALHATAGAQHAFTPYWTLGIDFTHEQGVHAYRRYQFEAGFTLPAAAPNVQLYRTDNRSSYNAVTLQLQGNISRRFNLIANYTLASAKTWGCVLGELFDYVNGVCNPLNAFAKGDYGPSGEDVRHRAVVAGTFHMPVGLETALLFQAESARPYTLTTSVAVNGLGDNFDNRAIVNGAQTTLDQFRGAPFVQADLRVSRPLHFRDRWSVEPFVEFFNLFNRNNPGANFVTNVAALPVPQAEVQAGNVQHICGNADCSTLVPITSLRQLRIAAGALGDFFGPGTTVGIPFAAQLGLKLSF